MALILSGLIFVVFAINVVLGATSRSAFMGDVAEWLTLSLATAFFVVEILKREAARDAKQNKAD
jgi:hypothetical protein